MAKKNLKDRKVLITAAVVAAAAALDYLEIVPSGMVKQVVAVIVGSLGG